MHQKKPYISRLRHLENHTEAVDLYLMNWHINRLNVEWISAVSLSVILWIVDFSVNLLHVMKNRSTAATLTPRNRSSVPINLPNPLSKNRLGPKVMLCVWRNFEGVIHWEFVPNGRAVDADLYSQQLERVHKILRRRYPALVNRNRVLLQQDNARSLLHEQPWQKFRNWEKLISYHTQHTAQGIYIN